MTRRAFAGRISGSFPTIFYSNNGWTVFASLSFGIITGILPMGWVGSRPRTLRLTARCGWDAMRGMAGRVNDWWVISVGLARVILHDRSQRRKLMLRVLVGLLGMFALGLWGIDGWLRGGLWRFVGWWGGCGLLAVFVFLLAGYDALAVIREERAKIFGKRDDSSCDDGP